SNPLEVSQSWITSKSTYFHSWSKSNTNSGNEFSTTCFLIPKSTTLPATESPADNDKTQMTRIPIPILIPWTSHRRLRWLVRCQRCQVPGGLYRAVGRL